MYTQINHECTCLERDKDRFCGNDFNTQKIMKTSIVLDGKHSIDLIYKRAKQKCMTIDQNYIINIDQKI